MLKARLLTGFIYFLVTLVFAINQSWTAADIVWSVWLGSLFTSAALIFVAIVVAPLSNAETKRVIVERVSLAFGPDPLRHGATVAASLLCFACLIVLVFTLWLHLIQASFMTHFFQMMGTGVGNSIFGPTGSVIAAYWPFAGLALLFHVPIYMAIISGKRQADISTPFIFLMYNFGILIGMIFVSLISPDTGAKYFALFAYFLPFEAMGDSFAAARAKRANR